MEICTIFLVLNNMKHSAEIARNPPFQWCFSSIDNTDTNISDVCTLVYCKLLLVSTDHTFDKDEIWQSLLAKVIQQSKHGCASFFVLHF